MIALPFTNPLLDRAPGSGPLVARAFHRALALVFLIAWLSLGVQVHLLVGSRGLLPLAPFITALHRARVPWWEFPSLFRLDASDGALTAGIFVGTLFSLSALAGIAPRSCATLNTALYLSYVVACRTFTAFQWDNLLLECGLLASWLPPHRRARWIHVLFRVLLFKLYFESGLAKWQSHLHDWQDGSAMTLYYQTAPLPTALAWYAHHLPTAWHQFESFTTLALELVVPFCFFAPAPVRRAAAALLTAFQLVNAATANYGFFCYLTVALHLFLLDDRDLLRAWLALRRRRPHRVRRWRGRHRLAQSNWARAAEATLFVAVWSLASLYEGLTNFVRDETWQTRFDQLDGLHRHYRAFRLVNAYHLFGHITRERIEPEFQTFDGVRWTPHDLRHKPGDPNRAPDWVAPHQPRVDFQLWFYGLTADQPAPGYVRGLLARICSAPSAVQPLFRDPLPAHAEAVRVGLWRYRFSTYDERRATGAWWVRESLGSALDWPCS